ncbi:MAG: respiratory nitrate reductase subunit gamma [bacterium]|nr:respiratory nitrate reductase subunit gamma [bacterium]
MGNWTHYLDVLLYSIFPYAAITVFVLAALYRYFARPFSYSSLSSQFLGNKQHFLALVPFHYAMITILLGHLIGFLIPKQVLLWNGHPLRLYILETVALACGLILLYGILAIIVRRFTNSKARVVTTFMDWVIYLLLLIQIVAGVYVAVFHPWGSSWFAATAAPYLWSIVLLNPDISYIIEMPFMAKLHIVTAFIIITLVPFGRLAHVLVAPLPYLWRKPQVVRWYGSVRKR